jgi:riboflavin-specific deaminase-like protein
MTAAALEAEAAWAFLRRLTREPQATHEAVALSGGAWTARGAVSAEAAYLLDLYLPLLPPQAPETLVIGQLGQSLDGRIATESGHSHYVTGEANRTHLHRLRALCDAVVVGGGTAAADDPRLTVRLCEGTNPVRVVLDTRARVADSLTMFRDGAAPTLLVRSEADAGVAASTEVVALPDRDGRIEPAAIVAALRARGLRRILVEGGGVTVSRFLEAGCLDRLHVAVAPLLIGSGRPGLAMRRIETLHEARRPAMRRFAMPPDTLFDCDLRAGQD